MKNPKETLAKVSKAVKEWRDREIAKNLKELLQKERDSKKKSREKEVEDYFDMIRKFRQAVRPGWTYTCVCCHTKNFGSQVVVYDQKFIDEIKKKVDEVHSKAAEKENIDEILKATFAFFRFL